MPRALPKIQLSEAEARKLAWIIRNPATPFKKRLRAKVVRSRANDIGYAEIAEKWGCSKRTVAEWCRRFALNRLSGLDDKAGRGRTFAFATRALTMVRRRPPGASGWSYDLLAARLHLDVRSVKRFFEKDPKAEFLRVKWSPATPP
jgi:transposase